MKANAPEKIYLNPLLMEDGESIVKRCTFERQSDSQIEYTRTDAFIKRIHELLSCRIDYITYYHDKTEFINEIIEDISEDIE